MSSRTSGCVVLFMAMLFVLVMVPKITVNIREGMDFHSRRDSAFRQSCCLIFFAVRYRVCCWRFCCCGWVKQPTAIRPLLKISQDVSCLVSAFARRTFLFALLIACQEAGTVSGLQRYLEELYPHRMRSTPPSGSISRGVPKSFSLRSKSFKFSICVHFSPSILCATDSL